MALMESIRKDGFNPFSPLIVDAHTRTLTDGHLRWACLWQLCLENGWNPENMPISYTVIYDIREKAAPDKIVEYNTTSAPWNAPEYMSHMIARNGKAYIILRDAMELNIKEKAKGSVKPILSLGHAVIAYTHNTMTSGCIAFKEGRLPLNGDVRLVDNIAKFIQDHHIVKTKTELIRALVYWFAIITPTLSHEEQIWFSQRMMNYNEMHEDYDHINTWLRFIGRRAKKRDVLKAMVEEHRNAVKEQLGLSKKNKKK